MNNARPALDTPGRALSQVGVTASFSRHRYEMPLLTVFLGLALFELVAVHLLVSIWSMTATWVLTALSIMAVVQITLLIRGMIRHPTEIDGTHVHVRHGRAGRASVPLAGIDSAEYIAFAPEERGGHVFRASLIASPNVALRLGEPLQVGRSGRKLITLRLDEPQAFLSLLAERQAMPSK